jgi:hypothetical protein
LAAIRRASSVVDSFAHERLIAGALLAQSGH